jgi:hypothetical protein
MPWMYFNAYQSQQEVGNSLGNITFCINKIFPFKKYGFADSRWFKLVRFYCIDHFMEPQKLESQVSGVDWMYCI